MSAGWKVFWLSAIVFAAAYGLARLLVPDVVPVGYAEEPQQSWAVLTAFVLRAIELTAGWVGVIALLLLAGAGLREALRRARNDRRVTR
ncbi:hypothetical protein [Bradyrhizobium sp.]|uniref:hypothetical protein n=1 Tax=Bradyrhizobium sp. TaxID=376 RepID=UPI0039E4CB62